MLKIAFLLLFCISQAKNQIFFARVKSSARVKRVPRPIFANFIKYDNHYEFLRGGGGLKLTKINFHKDIKIT